MRFVLFLWLLTQAAAAAVPQPRQHFGYELGTDYKVANYAETIDYFKGWRARTAV